MPLSERIQQVNREISATVERAISDLRQEVSQHLRSGHEEILRRLNEISPSLPGAFIPEHLGAEADALEQAAREAAQQAAGVSEETAARRAGEARSAAFTAVRDALAGIDRARSQAEILSALLRESARFAARSAVFLVRGAELRGWGGQGFGDAEEAIRQLTLAPPAGGGWSRLAEGQAAVRLSAGEAGVLCSRIETALPHEGVLIPLVLRDRVAAGLYADRAEGELACEALQALCHAAAMAIELLPFRERPFTPTLALDDGTVAPPEEPPAPAVPVPEPVAPEPVAAAAPEPEPEAPALEAAAATFATTAQAIPPEEAWAAPVAPEPAAVTEPEVEAEVDAEPEVEVEAEVDVEAFVEEAPPVEVVAEPEPEPEPAPDVPAAPPWSAAATVFQPIPAELRATPPAAPEPPPPPASSPDQTVLLPRTQLGNLAAAPPPPTRELPLPVETPPVAPPLRPVPVAEPAPAGGVEGVTPEVRPPSGVDGPGWAFSAARAAAQPNEDHLHDEARRLARLLVSEVKLYNEEQVEEGRRKRDIYERLREDIERSRQMYQDRVEPRILKSTDYFYQELVRILAAGDAKALGI
ncbi:MAG TPA: hypothetical protein DD490_07790 [Acidobacteria bacterium]|nr:hypothetical protein [Acidobacteriota bacterium]